nr:hypothetical protein [Brevibacillus thermoruber]
MNHKYPIIMLCKIAEVSRSGYYKWKAARESRKTRIEQDTNVKEHILAIHRLRPYFGYKRMRTALHKEGVLKGA